MLFLTILKVMNYSTITNFISSQGKEFVDILFLVLHAHPLYFLYVIFPHVYRFCSSKNRLRRRPSLDN